MDRSKKKQEVRIWQLNPSMLGVRITSMAPNFPNVIFCNKQANNMREFHMTAGHYGVMMKTLKTTNKTN